MDIASLLFPQAPSYATGLLGEEEAARLQGQARQAGLLNLGLGLLAAGGPAAVRPGLGQGLIQGLSAGQQAYQNVYSQRLQEMELARKIAEQRQLEQEQLAARQLMPKILTQGQQTPTFYGQPTQAPLRDDEGNLMPGAGMRVGQPQIDMNTLQALLTQAPSVAARVLPTVEAFRKMTAPERVTLSEGQQLYEMTPEGMQPIAGAPKMEKPAARVLEAMQVLGINVPVSQLSPDQRKQIENFINQQEERKAPKVAVDLTDPTAVAKAKSSLLGDWRGVLKDVGAFEISDRFAAAVNAVKQGNAGNKAADGALIYAVGKIYDPSGAVQEGDKNTILGNRSIPDTIKAYANSVFSGQTLLPEERNKLLAVVSEQVKSRAASIERQKGPYAEIAKAYGSTEDILRNPIADQLTALQSMTTAQPSLVDMAREELKQRELKRNRGQ